MKGMLPDGNDVRNILGLASKDDSREPSALKQGTSAAVSSVMQLAQHSVYAEMQAGQIDNKLSKSRKEYDSQPTVTVKTVTETQTTRRLPKNQIQEADPSNDPQYDV